MHAVMNHSMKNQYKLKHGTVIEGKWHHKRYVILRELGSGANGIVYLAQSTSGEVALKMSDNGMSITSEVNVLKAFAKVQGSTLGPSLLDVDDWEVQGSSISYYVMEYIHGPDLLSFIEQREQTWTSVLILQLLSDLAKLHENGWVFGDLKPENLIVTGPPPEIRCIDVGGTTLQGRAIKEFTEFYDRGYWGLGTRKADSAYDLFAVAMIIINTSYPKRFEKNTGGIGELKKKIKEKQALLRYESVLMSALEGKYDSAQEMRQALLRTLNEEQKKESVKPKSKSRQQRTGRAAAAKQPPKGKGGFFETAMLVLIISFLYFIYLYGQLV